MTNTPIFAKDGSLLGWQCEGGTVFRTHVDNENVQFVVKNRDAYSFFVPYFGSSCESIPNK